MDEPEAAPGERAADENDIERDHEAHDNAVEMTTVPETEDDASTPSRIMASSEQKDE